MNANVKQNTGRIRTSKPERYHHLRYSEGSTLEFDNGRKVANVTAFIREGNDGKLYAAFAECDARDPFNRKRGRTVSRRKWFLSKRIPVDSADFDTVFVAGGYLEADSNDAEQTCCDVAACCG